MPLMVVTPLRIEMRAVEAGLLGAWNVRVVRSGMGPDKARARARALSALPAEEFATLAVAGFGAGVGPGVEVGDVVVASEVRGPDGTVIDLPESAVLLEWLHRVRPQLKLHLGPIETVDKVVKGRARQALRERGVFAADMESVHLLAAAGSRPAAVLRVITDTPERELLRPRLLVDGFRAFKTLRHAAPALLDWATDERTKSGGTAGDDVRPG
ncbi:1-hydroxy-2-methyl-2-butenyl 4-diphosphate reductase [Streptomyces sp. SID3343]|uniref:phosphorylase family protein n=1 Tax=Streptomyces sp. SID3343 TaxID=2690260 RepID=UPI001369993B|nr:1-hydroxy-2-methyl-2-butenyl 4-diphosphate reductase [Streptomyces sp. SID3343]MYW06397.1 1-hydroxy-2-methyl-2-butenyl 4-diphosphate reductase [Streptomyces sp. SID3343]